VARTPERIAEICAAVHQHGSQSAAARALGIAKSTVCLAMKDAPHDESFEIAEIPDEDIPTAELLKHRAKQFAQKAQAKEAKRLIPVTVRVDGPIGIAHFGDPHVDDDGTNIIALQRELSTCTPSEDVRS
jgi:hypothetical protein